MKNYTNRNPRPMAPLVPPVKILPKEEHKKHSLAMNKPYQQTFQIDPSEKDLEEENTRINSEQFLYSQKKKTSVPDSTEFPTDLNDYSYVVLIGSEINAIFDSKSELEEYLDTMFFQEDSNVDVDSLQILKKIPLKIGAHVSE